MLVPWMIEKSILLACGKEKKKKKKKKKKNKSRTCGDKALFPTRGGLSAVLDDDGGA